MGHFLIDIWHLTSLQVYIVRIFYYITTLKHDTSNARGIRFSLSFVSIQLSSYSIDNQALAYTHSRASTGKIEVLAPIVSPGQPRCIVYIDSYNQHRWNDTTARHKRYNDFRTTTAQNALVNIFLPTISFYFSLFPTPPRHCRIFATSNV